MDRLRDWDCASELPTCQVADYYNVIGVFLVAPFVSYCVAGTQHKALPRGSQPLTCLQAQGHEIQKPLSTTANNGIKCLEEQTARISRRVQQLTLLSDTTDCAES